MHDRNPWTRGADNLGRKKNLVEFTRQCATCQKPFSIFVTQKIAAGEADSNSFGLKNCEEHRRNKAPANELETLRAELAALYARDKDQFAEIQELKAKLAAYELQAQAEGVTHSMEPMSQDQAARLYGYQPAQNKMPWE